MPSYLHESRHGGRVAGIDEVGRGPLAGPVLAAAVIFTAGVPDDLASLLDDSKKLTSAQRDAAYAAILACRTAEVAVGAASVADIARINILHAAMLAMARAVQRLSAPPDVALVDGRTRPPLTCTIHCIVGGDALSFSIAAASIVAKVTRDRAMTRLHARFPHYGWDSNAGYATGHHRRALAEHGPTRHHRESFGTVRALREQSVSSI